MTQLTARRDHGKLGDMNKKPQGPDFQTLILNLKRDRSYETISKLAGGQPKAKALQQIVQKGFTRLPDVATFDGLSVALNVSKRELVLAAARTLGIDVGDDDQNDLILVGAKRLPQESQDILVSMSREMQAWKDGRRDVDDMDAGTPEQDEDLGEAPDNVHHLRTPQWDRAAADKGDAGIDPEQLPDD